ncbi:hypothetical protein AB0D49_08100 [Streptomyces sp. NPDC048290]|uniref:hypothetical protein n=1 Tax=Streptomyces sp. NPDC048290 TaxID=3155811 RepID=UPI003422F9AA
MRIHTAAATAALLLATLTACGGGGKGDESDAAAADPAESVDCTSQTIDQAEWTEHCSDEVGTGGDGTEDQPTEFKFGETYTWPDGLKVTVTEAKIFTDYNADMFESADPAATEFRLLLKLENTGKAAVDLEELSTIIDGATNGGSAASTIFHNGSQPLEGRLAPGVTATKTDDSVLETMYGKKIVVTVQRTSDDFSLDYPEFTGEITG